MILDEPVAGVARIGERVLAAFGIRMRNPGDRWIQVRPGEKLISLATPFADPAMTGCQVPIRGGNIFCARRGKISARSFR
ncbi:hypothetical protein [Burkholderia gladioli]|uniref:hypothetical protein n=1 Tax=Burkholderia gladioli TaxID=28095 RepID=UPI001364AA2D|nr:hypothetical protein [Burkholderia gladioli]NRF86323.1 hypothetical protein [Burkholderia gladioli]